MRRIALLGLFFIPSLSHAVIVPDAMANSGFFTTVSSTFNITITTGLSNTVLVVGCGADVPTSIKAVTFDDSNMTQRKLISTNEWSFLYTRNIPSAGKRRVVVTLGSAVDAFCGAVAFSGVDQTTPVESSNSADLTGANPTLSATVLTNGSFIVDTIFENGTTVSAPTTTATPVFGLFNAGGPAAGGMSFRRTTDTGNQALSWTVGSADWAKVIIGLKPAVVNVSVINSKLTIKNSTLTIKN